MCEGDVIKIMCRDGKPNYVQQSLTWKISQKEWVVSIERPIR